ncbi:LPXTG cell wall anchor domain-containing protein [Micromonospora halotolerans]|uniref:LPXTG cell wall anchor domain-containing protein n=1 Tax=Micromonospora halotolerans TaxID=709879 RepID=A0ABZ0A6H2_9ACTN|nr:LPXTG cell wall anchor domain-containing protein [Micromonospora halotolerans]WNM42201.1 LPXTG cell wall anchor domain-containing protein [Micromonospora halotolerans]
MKKVLSAAVFALALPAALVLPSPASAQAGPVSVASECHTGWYVNPDEAALLPKQTEAGFLFDGPSLVHHATNVALADVPDEVGFTAADVTGAKPLFKMETTAQYSTINVTADGKFWSSKIPATDEGGQNKPVDKAGDLVGKWSGYTEATRVVSFGVGYANDTGNKATVTSITFGTKYALGCKEVSAEEPGHTPPTCTTTGTVTPKTTEGVTYTATRKIENGVTVSATVTATAKEGYVLKEGTATWTYPVAKLTGAQCEESPSPDPSTSSPAPTAEPTTTPAATPSVSTSPVGNAGGGSDDGGLPVTGADVLTVAGLGGLLVAVGGALFWLTRRRRVA